MQCGLGPDRREHAMIFTGTEATLILDGNGWELIAEPKKRTSVVEMRRRAPLNDQMRARHAGNFLECCRTRKAPVENLEVGHHVSAVAMLGNIALRSRSRVEWDGASGTVVNNAGASELLGRAYRAPWKLGA